MFVFTCQSIYHYRKHNERYTKHDMVRSCCDSQTLCPTSWRHNLFESPSTKEKDGELSCPNINGMQALSHLYADYSNISQKVSVYKRHKPVCNLTQHGFNVSILIRQWHRVHVCMYKVWKQAKRIGHLEGVTSKYLATFMNVPVTGAYVTVSWFLFTLSGVRGSSASQCFDSVLLSGGLTPSGRPIWGQSLVYTEQTQFPVEVPCRYDCSFANTGLVQLAKIFTLYTSSRTIHARTVSSYYYSSLFFGQLLLKHVRGLSDTATIIVYKGIRHVY